MAALNEKALAAVDRAIQEQLTGRGVSFSTGGLKRFVLTCLEALHASEPDAVAVERARCSQLARMHAHHALWVGIAPYGTYGADTDDKTLENFGQALASRIADRISAETHAELGDRLLTMDDVRQARAVLSPRPEQDHPPLPAGSLMRPAVKP